MQIRGYLEKAIRISIIFIYEYLVIKVENFWESLGNFFKEFGYSLYLFWIKPADGSTPYILKLFFSLIFLVLGYFLIKLFINLLRKALKISKKKFANEKTIKNFIVSFCNITLNLLLVLTFLGFLGVNFNGLAQIFSSAILAIGLSLQDLISNFASGLIILSNKPFIVGDYIDLDNGSCEGTVIDVKFLNTVLQTFDGQVIVIQNKAVISSVIKNYSTNPIRRINITIALPYDTDIDLAKESLLSICDSEPSIQKDPKPVVYITDLNEYTVNFSLRCYVPTSLYRDILFNFNELILRKFKEEKIQLPRRPIQVLDENNKQVEVNNYVE